MKQRISKNFYCVSALDAQSFPVSKMTVFQALTQALGLETQVKLSNLETDTIIQYLNSLGVGTWRLEKGIEAFKSALFQDLPVQIPVLVKMPIQALYLLETSVGILTDGKSAEFFVKLKQDMECRLNYLNEANDIEVLSLIP